ncbi:MAG: hypothetical protein FJ004_03585 [Chloroflexi bacterium]|nr:hypothetical protein [Chloroflexota bacterium]
MSTLRMILPEPGSEAVENAFLERLRAKMLAGTSNLMVAVEAVRAKYGKERMEVLRRAFAEAAAESGRERAQSSKDNSLRAFCTMIEKACIGSHEWEKVEDSDDRQTYRFTRCMWAEAFKECGASDIGFQLFCSTDAAIASAFNPAIRYSRTRNLMKGDDCCNHVFYLKK